MLTLYQRTDCPFCWKVRIALTELSLEYEAVDTRLGEKHAEVLRLSPTGNVPVLVDGDIAIWESSVILDYLDHRYALGRLIPFEPVAETRVRLLQAYSDKTVGISLRDLVFEKRSKPKHEWDNDVIRQSEEKWATCQAWLESEIGNREFFGDRFSAADCALAARFGIAEAYGAAIPIEYPKLRMWFQTIKARRSWKVAYPSSFIRTE